LLLQMQVEKGGGGGGSTSRRGNEKREAKRTADAMLGFMTMRGRIGSYLQLQLQPSDLMITDVIMQSGFRLDVLHNPPSKTAFWTQKMGPGF
jgi:hypothetical protein